MKISNSKKQLAKIIHENGGWHDGAAFATQDKLGTQAAANEVAFYKEVPEKPAGSDMWNAKAPISTVLHSFQSDGLLPNWHQTVLSRDEYFHLYPVAEATPDPAGEAKPSIEQLASDYRNLLDFARRKQEEADDASADAAKADAEAKLAELVAAGKALGLVLSVAPVQKYTGKFYNAKLGTPSHYETGQGDEICEGCGRSFGNHVGVLCGGDQNA